MKLFFQTVCCTVSVLCFLYYLLIVFYAGISADFAWIWPIGGLFFLFLFWLERKTGLAADAGLRGVLSAARGLLLIGILVCVWIGSGIIGGMRTKPEQDLDYVIVLGAQVRGSTVSRALKKRLDCALEYAQQNPDTVFLLSGGQGPGEDITEADAMCSYLTEHGLPKERLILETRSTTTEENLRLCAEILDLHEQNVGILSNNFHVYRAGKMAELQGYQNVSLIPAPSDPIMQPHYILREIFAVLFAAVRGTIKLW